MVSLKELVSGDYDEALQIKAEIDKINELLSILNPKSEDYDAWKNKRDILQKKYDEAKKRTKTESLKESFKVGDMVMTPNGAGKVINQKDFDNYIVDVSGNRGIYNIKQLKMKEKMVDWFEGDDKQSAQELVNKLKAQGKNAVIKTVRTDGEVAYEVHTESLRLNEATISLTQARDQLADSMFDKKRYADCTPENKAKIDAELKLKGIEAVISQDDENTFKVEALDDNFSKGFEIEKSEHPTLDDEAIKNLVMDHLEENPNYYDNEEGETLYPKEAEGDGPDEEWKILVADPQKTEKYARTPDEMAQFLFKKNYAQCTPDEKKEVDIELNDLQKELGENYKKEYNENDFERTPIQKCLDCGNQFQGGDNDKCPKCGSRNISRKESLNEASNDTYGPEFVKLIKAGKSPMQAKDIMAGKYGKNVADKVYWNYFGHEYDHLIERKESLKEENTNSRWADGIAMKLFKKKYNQLTQQEKDKVNDTKFDMLSPRESLKEENNFDIGNLVKIKPAYGGGNGEVIEKNGDFITVKTSSGKKIVHSSDLIHRESFKEEGRSLELTAKKMFNKSYDELNDQQKKKVDDEVMLDLWMGL